jgi:EspA/EspE family
LHNVGALDAFMSIWNGAHSTFGQGVPDDGARIDQSGQLRQIQDRVQSAAPGSAWTGDASESYGDANTRHARTFGDLAVLDKKLATEVGNSAAVVAAGRRDLDDVRQRVLDAAAAVPNTKDREKLLWPIVGKGSGEIADIMTRSDSDLRAIAGRISGIGGQYQAVGLDAKEGIQGDGSGDDPGDSDKKPPVDPKQAEHDVKQVLAGQATPEELARVRDNLHLTAEQQADYSAGRHVNLSPQQQQVLGQMQAQTHGMGVNDIRTAEQRLGADNHLVSDSLQMMSDDQFSYARVLPEPGALGSTTETSQGGVHGLPDSMQKALSKDMSFYDRNFDKVGGLTQNANDVSTIADIVRDGDPKFQHGTGLDKGMLDWSADSLEHGLHDNPANHIPGLGSDFDGYVSAKEDALDKVFYAAGQDHVAVHDELQGASGQQFLDGLHKYEWADPSHSGSTHGLLDWIGTDAVSPDVATATNAGESAHSLATYLDGAHEGLLNHGGGLTSYSVGNYDPALVQADATALAPFQRAMVGDLSGTHGFGDFGHPSDGDYSSARNVFAVIDSDPGAAKMFNAAAEQNIVNYQNGFANGAATDPNFGANAPHYDDLRHAANLLGVVNGGADEEALSRGLNDNQRAQAVYEIKKGALDMMLSGGVDQVPGLGKVPGIGIAQSTLETGILGDTAAHVEATHQYPTHSVQQGLDMSAYKVATALQPHAGDFDSNFFDPSGHLLPPDQIKGEDARIHYSEQLQRYLGHHPDIGLAMGRYVDQYDFAAGLADGQRNPHP